MSFLAITDQHQVHLQTLSDALKLAIGEKIELVDTDIKTGNYRVFYLSLAAALTGDICFTFELHRQTPTLKHWLFEPLSFVMGHPDENGLCYVKDFEADGTINATTWSEWLPSLGKIADAIRHKQRPADTLLKPFLSNAAYVRWVEVSHMEGVQ